MSLWSQFLWVIFPYLSLVTFVIGHVYRYRYDQYGWTPKSSQILERRFLIWGVLLFHWGLLFVIGGHAMGLLVPIEVYDAMGVSDHNYHLLSLWAGSLVGFVALVGILLLNVRRWFNRRVRASTETMKFAVDGLLLLVIVLGMAATVGYRARQRHLERLVEVALESFGSLDALVYAARVSPDSLDSFDLRSWGDCVDVNVRGFLYAAGAALPAMLERGGGHIVDLAADSGDGALERAVRSARRDVREGLRTELSRRGVGVSGIVPGPHSAEEVCRLLASIGG